MTNMKTTRTIAEALDMWVSRGGAMALAMGLTIASCGSAEAGGTDQADASKFIRVINVEVAEIRAETFVEEIRLTSVAMANQDVLLEAEESGVIRTLFVDRGDRVSAGEAVAKIDDRLLVTQVAQARAAADLAAQTWERRQRLWEGERVGSELAYLEARYAADQAAAALQGFEERLARTVVRAPFSGILDERHVDVGTMVGPGKTIGRLVDLDPIKVFAGVPERYAMDVRVGASAQMVFEALGPEVFTAPIRYVAAAINPGNRTFAVEVELPNRNGHVKPQMVANMAVTRRQVDDAIVVPQDALVRVEAGYVVFVVSEQGGHSLAEVRPVELGPTRRNLVVVEAGVVPGEQLIVVGQKSVSNGDRINIVGRGDSGR
ncbi:MAG: efflux RND transporter periplasmic adaptor subunit [Gemmatimonadetes bacterium]|nr:efflux RND transporter periplasmic adaptor subunit [Gemmatimonadota bacterium]MDA1104020.1 efflux RND transporter periplasmic adaptor subunit [Gemmatimonadota bacterium]